MLIRRFAPEGFSLVELMIGIAVLGVLTALAFPSYKAWLQNTRIKTTAASILNGLQIARSEAVRRNAPVQFVLAADTSWTVGCVPPLTAQCPDATIQSRSAREGSTAAITTTTGPAIVFSALGIATPTPTQFDVRIDPAVLAHPPALWLNITLGTGGNARMCDADVSSISDPRHC